MTSTECVISTNEETESPCYQREHPDRRLVWKDGNESKWRCGLCLAEWFEKTA